jgi:hypothetical protein
MAHGVLPLPRQKVCKVFEVDTLGLDFGLRLTLNRKARRGPGLGFSSDLSLSAVSMGSMSDSVISHVAGE